MEFFGQVDPSLVGGPPPLYSASCRWARKDGAWLLETWAHPLTLGRPLPTIPLWLTDNLAVPLELELSYEETCRVLRIPQSSPSRASRPPAPTAMGPMT